MSGFPVIEADRVPQLIIVHMDDSESTIMMAGHEGWTETRTGIMVHRGGGRTTFPFATIKSYTVVYPDEALAEIDHLDPDGQVCPGCRH